jgi:hypothetical protein
MHDIARYSAPSDHPFRSPERTSCIASHVFPAGSHAKESKNAMQEMDSTARIPVRRTYHASATRRRANMPPASNSFRRTLIAAAFFASPFVLLASAYAENPTQEKGQTAAQKFKNIRVLKNLPADQLVPLMHTWNNSLGVQCNFCHEVETNSAGQHVGWEKDVKPEKGMARKMVEMTMKLNKSEQLLGGRATCFMCHHGHANPELKAPEAAK